MIRVGKTRNLLRAPSSLLEIWTRSAHHHPGQWRQVSRTNRPDKSTHSITCSDDQKILANRAASKKRRMEAAERSGEPPCSQRLAHNPKLPVCHECIAGVSDNAASAPFSMAARCGDRFGHWFEDAQGNPVPIKPLAGQRARHIGWTSRNPVAQMAQPLNDLLRHVFALGHLKGACQRPQALAMQTTTCWEKGCMPLPKEQPPRKLSGPWTGRLTHAGERVATALLRRRDSDLRHQDSGGIAGVSGSRRMQSRGVDHG